MTDSGSRPHPTRLVHRPPWPRSPLLAPTTAAFAATLLAAGILSDAQLESADLIVRPGSCRTLAVAYTVDETYDLGSAAAPEGGRRRGPVPRGWFLGDGTGAGKGREVAASSSTTGLGPAASRVDLQIRQADGGRPARLERSAVAPNIVPLSRFRQGAAIALDRHPLHHLRDATHPAKGEKASRVQQIIDWLGRDFDGVIVFDEAHAMANAAGDKGERGEKKPSQQGQAGLRLQMRCRRAHPLRLGHRRHDGAEPRLCRPARPLGHRRLPLRDPGRICRGDGRRRRSHGSVARDLKASASTSPARCRSKGSSTKSLNIS